MVRDFQDQVVILTGGAGDIAKASAARFAAGGAKLALFDSDGDGLDSIALELRALELKALELRVSELKAGELEPGESNVGESSSEKALLRRLDVTDVDAVGAAVDEVHAEFGRIDILVNCAGIYRHKKVLEMSAEDWAQTLDVNLKGVFAAGLAAGRWMSAQESGGAIVNLASVAAQRGSPLHAHYSASKAGIIGFGRSLALELAPRVRVNAVAPGIIDSRMIAEMLEVRGEEWRRQIPLDRLGTPEDVADAICFLASGRASYIKGAVLNVNGGMWMD